MLRYDDDAGEYEIVCDFCGKPREQAGKLIEAHPHGFSVHICDECIAAAYEMLEVEDAERDEVQASG